VLDSEVESVRAGIGSPFHGLPADDACIAFLKLRNGLHVQITHAVSQARRGAVPGRDLVYGRDAAIRLVLESARGRS
jgi:hypothetical protein